MFSYTCFQQLYISTYPSEVRIQSPRPLFDSFHSDGITSSTLPPFLVREKQARLVTREAARDVIARTGRSTVKAPSACFAFLHSRGVSFARRFLRMNKPGLHPPAAARHPLPAAQSSLPAGKLLVCPPTSLFSHLPPGSSSSSSSMQAKLHHHHHPSFNYGVVQTPPSPCYCEWKPIRNQRCALFSSHCHLNRKIDWRFLILPRIDKSNRWILDREWKRCF